MLNPSEMVLVVDENDNPIDPMTRAEAHQRGAWHRNAHVWVINDAGELLCQQRSMKKDNRPGSWEAFFGGHMAPGQSYVNGAVTELNEELGLDITERDLIYLDKYKFDDNKHWLGIYAYKWNGDITGLHFEEDEVQQLAWHPLNEIKELVLIKKDPNWTYIGYEAKIFDRLAQL